jgi:hypothetical protein
MEVRRAPMLEHFTLGLRKELHFPEEGSHVESWLGCIDDRWMITVFYTSKGYNGIDADGCKYLLTIRAIPPGVNETRHNWYSPGGGVKMLLRRYMRELDLLALKCILLETKLPEEVT